MENVSKSNDGEETDESLMRRFQSGDTGAFVVLFNRYSTHLINFANRFLFSQEESEDAAQEVLLRIHNARDRYDTSRPFRPWLFSIASRLISNRFRQKKRHPIISLFRSGDEGDSPPADPPERRDHGPEQSMENKHLSALIQSSLTLLPENQRTAVILARFEDMTNEEIAQTMETSVSSVKSLLFRAKQTLKNALKQFIQNQPTPPKSTATF
ncbi:MAG TPA: RNA polymerase sigma factor [Alphaproteobacteria bacterium]|nr:RNA polymerase sigma factor [Alphaproteobacteria bacterium]